MKTNYLNDEQVNGIRVWAKSAKEYNERLDVVLNNIKKQMKKDTNSTVVAKYIDANWKLFKDIFAESMPHYRKNGSSSIIVCDWIEQKGNRGLNLAFAEYRFIKQDTVSDEMIREESVKLEQCVGHIEREISVLCKKKFTIKHDSGYEEPFERVMRDKDGKEMTKKEKFSFIPKEKTQWGYTDIVIDAFIEAADRLIGMIERGEIEK